MGDKYVFDLIWIVPWIKYMMFFSLKMRQAQIIQSSTLTTEFLRAFFINAERICQIYYNGSLLNGNYKVNRIIFWRFAVWIEGAVKYLTPSITDILHFHLTRWICIIWSCCQDTVRPFLKRGHHYPPLIILYLVRVSLSETLNPSCSPSLQVSPDNSSRRWMLCGCGWCRQDPGNKMVII